MSDSFATLLSVICHAPLSMGFSRQEHWSGLPFPSSGVFLTQGSNLRLLDWQEDYLQLSHYTKHAAAAGAKSPQSCPTLQPHRRQPTRLPRPWDSPGKNTGVGCHFLLHIVSIDGGKI